MLIQRLTRHVVVLVLFTCCIVLSGNWATAAPCETYEVARDHLAEQVTTTHRLAIEARKKADATAREESKLIDEALGRECGGANSQSADCKSIKQKIEAIKARRISLTEKEAYHRKLFKDHLSNHTRYKDAAEKCRAGSQVRVPKTANIMGTWAGTWTRHDTGGYGRFSLKITRRVGGLLPGYGAWFMGQKAEDVMRVGNDVTIVLEPWAGCEKAVAMFSFSDKKLTGGSYEVFGATPSCQHTGTYTPTVTDSDSQKGSDREGADRQK